MLHDTSPTKSRRKDVALTVIRGAGRLLVGFIGVALYLALFLWSPWRPNLRLDQRFRRASGERALEDEQQDALPVL